MWKAAMDAIERMKLIRDVEGGQIILSHSMEMYSFRSNICLSTTIDYHPAH